MLTWRQRLVAIAVALLAGAAIGYYQIKTQPVIVQDMPSTQPVAGLDITADFTLQNQDGETVTAKNWPDHYLLIYFGFTHCPDICPLGLGKMAEALSALPNDQVDKIQPLFITVDPARDTPAELKNYVGLFAKHLQGLTGTQQQIDKVIKHFRVYAQKQIIDGDDTNYMMNHSSYTYLMAPDGRMIDVYAHDMTGPDMAAKLKTQIK